MISWFRGKVPKQTLFIFKPDHRTMHIISTDGSAIPHCMDVGLYNLEVSGFYVIIQHGVKYGPQRH